MLRSALPEFDDGWVRVHGSDSRGLTFDSATNANLIEKRGPGAAHEQARYDRVMVGREARDALVDMHIVRGFHDVDFSDHFGLVARLQV